MKRGSFFAGLIFLAALALHGQEAAPEKVDDIDSVFGEDTGAAGESDDRTGEEGSDLISSVLGEKGVTLGASIFLLAGYSPGLNYLPGDVPVSEIEYRDMAIVKMKAALSFNARISPELRMFARIQSSLPDLIPEFDELFCDYSMFDAIFLRIGRQNIAWGISPNFGFTDLLARLPDNLTASEKDDDSSDSIAFKMNMPVGVGGFEAVMFSRQSLWGTDESPDVDEIGAGGRFNLALDNFDLNIGGFYHKDLHLRFFYSLKTTLPLEIEAYTEGLLAVDTNYSKTPGDQQVDFSANAGVYFDLFDRMLRINAEYFYNGEETELEIKSSLFPLFAGHNVALNASLSFFKGKFKLLFQGKYNITENSGVILPAMTLDVIPHCTFSLAVPYVIGPVSGGYFDANTDNDKRRISMVFAIILKGKI